VHVTRLQLQHFRNYAHADLRLAPGVHVFEGANGQGKTNLIEAIGYLATLSSHRVSSDAALVRAGERSAIVRAELAHGERQLDLEEPARSGQAHAPRGVAGGRVNPGDPRDRVGQDGRDGEDRCGQNRWQVPEPDPAGGEDEQQCERR